MAVIPMDVAERAATRAVPQGDCLVSTYSVASHGYAQIGWEREGYRTMVTAHRAAYVYYMNGQVPDDMDVDHLCHNRRCVRREHLRAATDSENSRMNWGHHYNPEWACPKNHDPARRRVRPDGQSVCRDCKNERERASRLRKKV